MAKNRRFEIQFTVINAAAKAARAEEVAGFRRVAAEADRAAKQAAKAAADSARQQVIGLQSLQMSGLRAQDALAKAAAKSAAAQAKEAAKLAATQERESARAAASQARDADRAARAQARSLDQVAKAAAASAAVQAREASRLADAQAREAKRASDESARGWSRANAEMLRDFRRAQAEQARSARATTAEMKKAAAEQAKAFSQSFVSVGSVIQSGFDLQDKLAAKSESSRLSTIGIGVAAGVTEFAIRKVLDVVLELPEAFDKAYQASLRLGGDFGKDRERLAELAATMGTTADNRFTVRNAEFNRKAGMTFDEGLAFRSEFRNAGEAYKGTKMSAEEFEGPGGFEEQAARLMVAKAINPKIGGDFAGGILGVKDYSKYGQMASENALADVNASIGILAAGQGNASVNLQQARQLNAALVNEDEIKGLINDPKQTAMLISAAAEFNPEDSFTTVQSSLKGLRAFGDKFSAPLLQKAGLTPDQMPDFDPIAALRKLAPVVTEEAKAKGLTVDDVLKGYFHDVRTSRGLGVLINRGVGEPGKGVFDQRQALLEGKVPGHPMVGGVPAAMAAIDDAGQSDRVAARIADATAEEAKTKRGELAANTDLLRKQAIARLEQRGEYGPNASTSSNLSDLFAKVASFGTMDVDEMKINAEIGGMLEDRGKRAGLDLYAPSIGNSWTAEGMNQEYNDIIKKITDAGGDWKSDGEVKQLLKDLPGKIAAAIKAPAPMVDLRPPAGRK